MTFSTLAANRSCCIALETISSHLGWSLMEDNVRKSTYICICDWVTLLYSRKLPEHCKPAVYSGKKNHLKNKMQKNQRLSSNKTNKKELIVFALEFGMGG